MKRSCLIGLLLATLCQFNSTYADTEWMLNDTMQLHFSGFGTLGLATSDISRTALPRDMSDASAIAWHQSPLLPDSRLGAQLDLVIDPHWSITLQTVLKDRPQQTLDDSLQWAFISFRPTSQWQLRVGRLAVDVFMLGDQRNVGYSYLPVRPPIDFYSLLPLNSYNGSDLVYQQRFNDTTFSLKSFVGQASQHYPDRNGAFSIEIGKLWGGSIGLSQGTWRSQVSYLGSKIESDVPELSRFQDTLHQAAQTYHTPYLDTLTRTISINNTTTHFLSIGTHYDGPSWSVLAEFARSINNADLTVDNYRSHVNIGYRYGKTMPYLGYSRIWPTGPLPHTHRTHQPATTPLLAAVDHIYRESRSDQETLSIGNRWDFYDHTALKVQYDLIHARGAGLWRTTGNTPSSQPDSWNNVLSLTVDFVF